MNFLAEEKYVRAWAVSFLEPGASRSLSIGEIREAYERANGCRCFSDAEVQIIRNHLVAVAKKFWGAVLSNENGSITDDTILTGIDFRMPEKVAGKPVLWVASDTVINIDSGFNHKGGLSTVGTANCGVACVCSCAYCSTAQVMVRNSQTDILRVLNIEHGDAFIRRLNAVETARHQLTFPDGSPRFNDPGDNRILENASIVEALGTNELMDESVELARTVFALTNWRIRTLTKSALLKKYAHQFSETERKRLLLGFSIGIPEDDVARVVEEGTTLPSTRFRIHRQLLDEGFTMFGMPCPVLAVSDFRALAERIATEIQPERLERIWVEVINRRDDSLIRTIVALRAGGHTDLAKRLAHVSSSQILWEIEYNRAAFLAFHEVIPPSKLAFLTYTTPDSELWWSQYATKGAVLL